MSEPKEILIGIGAIILVIWLLFYDGKSPHYENEPQQNNQDVVGFDEVSNLTITKQMSDTMAFILGHWYTKTQMEKMDNPKDNYHQKKHNLQWLRPVGEDYIYRKDKATERLWKQQQEKGF